MCLYFPTFTLSTFRELDLEWRPSPFLSVVLLHFLFANFFLSVKLTGWKQVRIRFGGEISHSKLVTAEKYAPDSISLDMDFSRFRIFIFTIVIIRPDHRREEFYEDPASYHHSPG